MIGNALTLLEVGEIGVCGFGETVKVLHPFTEQFTHQSGARILQQFSFEQKKTRIAQVRKINMINTSYWIIKFESVYIMYQVLLLMGKD